MGMVNSIQYSKGKFLKECLNLPQNNYCDLICQYPINGSISLISCFKRIPEWMIFNPEVIFIL